MVDSNSVEYPISPCRGPLTSFKVGGPIIEEINKIRDDGYSIIDIRVLSKGDEAPRYEIFVKEAPCEQQS